MKLSAAVIITVLLISGSVHATRVTFTGGDIPSFHPINASAIFAESDSLLLNGRVLGRDQAYRFDPVRRGFDLSGVTAQPSDTLVLIYQPVPKWLAATRGRVLPEVVPSVGSTPATPLPARRTGGLQSMGNLSLSGAKSFRFNARSAGTSDFSQSLDLTVSGELTPGLMIRGAVSDRGYDPAYGTANSRLNELNKINLELESSRLLARIGDIEVQNRLPLTQGRSKRMAGAWVRVRDPSWYVEAAAARPKGLFETVRLAGEDGVQGPYRIGSRSEPIVPGSETVWLDGRQITRGSNNDYTMDYPAGTITFTVNHPIDSRRRIEIDYEPQATDYREELFSGGGGVALEDSAFVFETGWLREGDDRGEPLTGDLSEGDRSILADAGDSPDLTYRSGVRADTSGDYLLVADSLPDSVYQYVGSNAGDYAVTFSYVGGGMGEYRNLGSNRFEYVGPANGDYLPVVVLAAPERTDQYVARGKWRDRTIGEVGLEYRHSEVDANLFSELDDDDNAGDLYGMNYTRRWGKPERGDGIDVRSRFREVTFRSRDRLYEPEFNRKFHLPALYAPVSDEWWHEGSMRVSPIRAVTLSPSGGLLRFDDGTEAQRSGVRLQVRPHRQMEISSGVQSIRTDVRSGDTLTDGEAILADGAIAYRPTEKWLMATGAEYDDRTNDYAGIESGTRSLRIHAEAGQQTEKLRVERYVEDSLAGDWSEVLQRTRLELHSVRRWKDLGYSTMAAYQWLDQPGADEASFLGRLNLQYSNTKRRLSVNGTYLLSEETRNVRGIAYLEVEPGQGDYVYEDGQYIPDPDGNFIKVEEVLSDRSAVSRGEKSFSVSKEWKVAALRFSSRIEEELLPEGQRSVWWTLPFYSDPGDPYQFYAARYSGELRIVPIRNAHAINIEASQNREIRSIGGSNRERRDRKGTLTFKQAVGSTHLEEAVGVFDAERDEYYSGAGIIDGWQTDLTIRHLIQAHELSAGVGYREAAGETGEESTQYLVRGGMRLAVVRKGELRSTLDLYRQTLGGVAGVPSYTLTDNRTGGRGAEWSVELRYGVRKDFRVNFTVSGRHSDDRTARVTARGEMVAEF